LDLSQVGAGLRLGGWRLERLLGRGAFGSTWSASDRDGNLAAVKVLRDPPGAELRSLARIGHPAVVTVLEGGGHPLPYLVMEYVDGRPLSAFLRSGSAPAKVAISVAARLADALAAIHHAGVTHGDLKPANILVESIRQTRLKVVDFGLADTGTGGTLAYAAPERLVGGGASRAADVYALGLVVWELFHGQLPWPELDLAEALLRRQHEVPHSASLEPEVMGILEQMLANDPANRPTAEHVADRLFSQGASLPEADLGLLRRRARACTVLGRDTRAVLELWLARGGLLGITGPSGSGRSQLLDWLGMELQARGERVMRITCEGRPWDVAEQALSSAVIPGPPAELPENDDVEVCARLAASSFIARSQAGVRVLVDDFQLADRRALHFLEALAEQGAVRICTVGSVASSFVENRFALPVLDREELRELILGLFGAVQGEEALVDRLQEVSGGLPGPAVSFLLACSAQEALVWRARRWHLDPGRLVQIVASGSTLVNVEGTLSEDARQLGCALSILEQGATVEVLSSLAPMKEQRLRVALRELRDAGLVRLTGRRAACRSRAARDTMCAFREDRAPLHRRVIAYLLVQTRPDLLQLGRHALGGRAAEVVRLKGSEILRGALRKDAEEAARLADGFWALAPLPELAPLRIRALSAVGRAQEARELAEELLGPGEPTADDVPVLVELARLEASAFGENERAMELADQAQQALGGAAPPAELIMVRAEALQRAGRSREAIATAQLVADELPPVEPEALDRWLRLRLIWAQAVQAEGELHEAIDLLAALPADLGFGRPARAILDADLGRLLWHANQLRDAADALALAAQEEAGLPALERAKLLNNIAAAEYMLGERPRALARWEQALILFERLEVDLEQVRVRVNLCLAYREMARPERALEAGAWAYKKAEEIQVHEYMAMAAGNLGDACMAQEAWLAATEWFERAERISREYGLESELVELARRRAELAVRCGDEEARELARLATELAAESDASIEAARASALLAYCCAQDGDLEEMARARNLALEPLKEAGAGVELAEARLWAAEALLLVGRTAEASASATNALVYAEEVGHQQLRRRSGELLDRIKGVRGASLEVGRLDRLMELAVALVRERDADLLLDAIVQAGLDLLQAERCFVLLLEGDEIVLGASAAKESLAPERPSMSIVRRVIVGGREVIAADIGERADLRDASSILAMDLHSAMCVPLTEGERVLGAIYVDSRLVSHQELTSAARLLRALAAHASVAVTNAQHLQEAATRGEAAAEIAHDLKGPAHAIHVVVSDLLSARPDGHPEREPLLLVLEAAQRLGAMAGAMLEEHNPVQRPIELSNLVQRVADLMRHVAAKQGIRIELDVQPDLWALGDPHELSRLLTNLISNSVKYSLHGQVVSVRLTLEDEDLLLEVRDRGQGIPADALGSVFQRGAQARGAAEGHGLGLYICRRIVEDHRGEIAAENHPEGGALFSVWLPRLRRSGVGPSDQ